MKPKVLLLATIALLISSSLFAQKPDTTKLSKIPDYRGVKGDSTVIPKGRQSQQTDFLKGAYMYPPKPRNMWEVGIGGGTAFVSGDVSSKIGYGFDAYVRKSLGYVLSARLMYNYEVMSGIDGGRQPGIEFNNALNGKNSAATDYYHDIGFVYDN